MALLTGLKVLEIGEHVSAPYAAANFVKLGAEVIKIEPPRGDVSRERGPYPSTNTDKDRSALFLAHNHGKKSVLLDLNTSAGQGNLRAMIPHFDLVLENQELGFFDRRSLGFNEINRINPG